MIPTSFDEFVNDPLFGVYLCCLILVLTVNIFKVILPLNKLRIECGFTFSEIRQERDAVKEDKKNEKKGNDSQQAEKEKEETKETKIRSLKNFLRGPSQDKTNERKLAKFLLFQTLLYMLPLIAAILVRFALGDPERISEWNLIRIIVPSIVFSAWVVWNIRRANSFSDLIEPYLKIPEKKGLLAKLDLRTYSPRRNRESLFLMIGITNFSRRNLKRLSEIKSPEYIEHEELDLQPLRIEDELNDGVMIFNKEGIIENAGKIGKRVSDTLKNTLQFGKGVAKGVSEQLTAVINNHIESKVKQWTKSNNVVGGFVENLAIVFIPIITIYCVPLI